MEPQTRSERVSTDSERWNWDRAVSTTELPLTLVSPPGTRPFSSTIAAIARRPAAWSRCDTVVVGYLLWMIVLWALTGHGQNWKWIRLDLLTLAYFALVAGLAPLRWFRKHALGRLGHSMFLLWAALPLAYWQSGDFGTRFHPSVEGALVRMDRVWFGLDWLTRQPPAPGWVSRILEGVYLSNYVLALGCVSLLLIAAAWVDWIGWKGLSPEPLTGDSQAVLTALIVGLLACYACFPLLPAVTPRLFFAQLHQAPEFRMRAINGWFLKRDSIPWGIFPCAHVAGITAMGVAFWRRRWFRAASIYGCASVLTAIATVYGDYHFACDAAAGALVGLTAGALLMLRQPALAPTAVPDSGGLAEWYARGESNS